MGMISDGETGAGPESQGVGSKGPSDSADGIVPV
jgi:hypothetical protein